MQGLSLYIHIPFCVKKCYYCDFLSAPCKEETKQKYVDALCKEIVQRAKNFQDRVVDTVFFGGGTPSLLSSKQMTQIMSTVRKEFQILPDAEITMEMNPGTVEREKLSLYKQLGINRLSIGLQSADNEELKNLGRIHTWEEFLKTFKMVREAGFHNVNIDLMSSLPGQTLESYEKTLRKILELKPEHISAYSLIIEEGTLFYEWYGEENKPLSKESEMKLEKAEDAGCEERKKNRKVLPDEITDRKMYEMTKKLLEEQGYYRYEISNYALPGYECKHNIGYWKRKEYLGLGLGAASLIFEGQTSKREDESDREEKINHGNRKNIRCSNISDLETYLKINSVSDEKQEVSKQQNGREETRDFKTMAENQEGSISELNQVAKNDFTKDRWSEEIQELSPQEQMEEFMFLGLRMIEGVSPEEFERIFGQKLKQVYGKQIEKLEKQGLLEFHKKNGNYALTGKGIDVSNQVFVEFI